MGERVGDIAIEHLRLGPHGDAYADALALRAALTQSAEKLAAAEAERAEGMEWLCRDTGCKPEAPLPVVAAYVHGLYCGATANVARLERTVERMTEKVAEWRLRIREVARGSVELEALDDVSAAMLAASSPDHAGAPENSGGEAALDSSFRSQGQEFVDAIAVMGGNYTAKLSRPNRVFVVGGPSVEAGEGDK